MVPLAQPLDVPELELTRRSSITQSFVRPVDLTDNPLRWFQNAPKLRRLSLAWPFFPSAVHVAWGRITHLKLDSEGSGPTLAITMRQCVDALTHCTALEYLELSAIQFQWGESLPIVEVSTLQTLVLVSDAIALCCYLSAPQLTRLSLCPNTHPNDDHCEAVIIMARRQSLRNLRYLFLCHSLFQWPHLDPLFEQLPELIYLHFTHSISWSFGGTTPRACCIGRLHALRTLSLLTTEAAWHRGHQPPRLPELLEGEIGRLSNLEELHLWNRPEPGESPDLDEWTDRQSKRGVNVKRKRGHPPFPDEMDTL